MKLSSEALAFWANTFGKDEYGEPYDNFFLAFSGAV